MALYDRLFAHGLALGDDAQHRIYGARKRALFADLAPLGEAGGTVVEIGPGTGVNLPYLPDGIRWIGLEPNPHMDDYLRPKLSGRAIDASLRRDPAQATGLPNAAADAVISTLVLCSVPDLAATLAELRRILKPGGTLYFVEHVAAPSGTWTRALQRGIKPVWRRLADGCRPDRDTGPALKDAGFSAVTYERFVTGLPVIAPHIAGRATR
jgi:SAM-dependent methyltransferase